MSTDIYKEIQKYLHSYVISKDADKYNELEILPVNIIVTQETDTGKRAALVMNKFGKEKYVYKYVSTIFPSTSDETKFVIAIGTPSGSKTSTNNTDIHVSKTMYSVYKSQTDMPITSLYHKLVFLTRSIVAGYNDLVKYNELILLYEYILDENIDEEYNNKYRKLGFPDTNTTNTDEIKYLEKLNLEKASIKNNDAKLTALKQNLNYYREIVELLKSHSESECGVPILYDMEAKRRVQIGSWVLQNRRNFMEYINNQFVKQVDLQARESVLKYDLSQNKLVKVDVFRHQKFISDFLQRDSPYRGILLYYGLGSGKTLSSINIAEGLDRQVIIMLPKSIKNNFKADLLDKGAAIYHTENVWCFYKCSTLKDPKLEEMGFPINNTELMTRLYMSRNGENGFWTISKTSLGKTSNFDEHTDVEKFQIRTTIDVLIDYKYKFIHYNGGQGVINQILIAMLGKGTFETIQRNVIYSIWHTNRRPADLTSHEKRQVKDKLLEYIYNPANKIPDIFGDKLVIIDEVHNFLSMVCNGSNNATIIYEMFMRSQNCKIVALSGTPIINAPFEISVLLNMLKGYITYIKLTLKRNNDTFDTKQLEQFLSRYATIDKFNINSVTHTISFTRIPLGFVKDGENHVKRDLSNNTDDTDFVTSILNDLNKLGYFKHGDVTVDRLTIFPDIFVEKSPIKRYTHDIELAQSTFNELYVDLSKKSVKNSEEFTIRSLGLISFYNEIVDKNVSLGELNTGELFPKIEFASGSDSQPIKVPMSQLQFMVYHNVREIERRNEKDQASDAGHIVADVNSSVNKLFKVFSRQVLLFTYPESIVRPRIEKIRCEKTHPDCLELKRKSKEDYLANIKSTLSQLDSPEYLSIFTEAKPLYELSPKMALILKNILNSPGLAFCYSQFRNAEGVELLNLVFKNNGLEFLDSSKKDQIIIGETQIFEVGNIVRHEISENNWITAVVKSVGPSTMILTQESDLFNVEYTNPNGEKYFRKSLETDITVNKDSCHRARYAIWSGTEDDDTRKNILEIYTHPNNLWGKLCLVLMTTSSGSEGINLKYVRQVHIMEPYWNKVRVDQVIGRARRIESHKRLPLEHRNVRVYEYVSTLTPEQRDGSWADSLTEKEKIAKNVAKINAGLRGDRYETSDETLYRITYEKYSIIKEFLNVIRYSSVDCRYNSQHNVFTVDNFDVKKCVSHIPGTSNYTFDPYEKPKTRLHNVLEREVKKHLHILPVTFNASDPDSKEFSILYELDSDLTTLSELKIDQIIPVYNFYTYYGVNPYVTDVAGTKRLIGSFRRESDEKIVLIMHNSFVSQQDLYAMLAVIIKSVQLPIPDYIDEAKLVTWVNNVRNIPKFKELLAEGERLAKPQEVIVPKPKRQIIKLNLAEEESTDAATSS